MSDLRTLKMQVQRQLKRDLAKANHYFNKQFPEPQVSYQLRGAKAGVAYLQQNEIRLNPILLQENRQQFIQEVVPHELAHLLVFQQFGQVSPHGKEWQMMMEQVLNVPANTYHCFDIRNVRQHFSYQCGCQTHLLTIRRHNAIQAGKQRYICKKCGEALRFTPSQAT